MSDKNTIEPTPDDVLAVIIIKLDKAVTVMAFVTVFLSLVFMFALTESHIMKIGLTVCFFTTANMAAIEAICVALRNVKHRIAIGAAIFYALFGVTVMLVSAFMLAVFFQIR